MVPLFRTRYAIIDHNMIANSEQLMQVLLTGAQYIPGDDPDQCVVDGVEFETNANMRQWQGLLVTDDLEDLVYRCSK